MKEHILKELVEKITAGVATDEEISKFNQWYQSFQEDGAAWPDTGQEDKEKIKTALLRSIDKRINSRSEPDKNTIYYLRRIAAAAIVLLILTGGIYWYSAGQMKSGETPALVITNDLAPGMEKAVLTLGDGSQIVLDEAEMGLLAKEGHTSVNKTENGLVSYQATHESDAGVNPSQVVYNTIVTPRGGKYKVILPDHTEVWLNAMSSIRFPTRFTGENRVVEMTGEVFFNVTRNMAQPFWVRSEDQIVKVLGTQFNVKAYSDEAVIRTTLLEGSVKVDTDDGQVTIEPGQQYVNSNMDETGVIEVDTELVTAWKNDLFQFWNTDLEEIMRQLSRWYDVDVTYLNDRKDISFTGFISRDVTISNVLHMLEETGNIKFGLDGRQVLVRIGGDKK